MALSIIEFNTTDDLDIRVMQKLNANFRAIVDALDGKIVGIATEDTPGLVMAGQGLSIQSDGSMDLDLDDLDSESF